MSELQQILETAERARRQGDEICLVTLVGVEGSSYRKPGARMLLTSSGLRAGTISGGCLEGEVIKKAWWLTAAGPSLQRYASFFDEDAGIAYGLGCGGTILLLLERGPAAEAVIDALRRTWEQREAVAVLTARGDEAAGTQLVMSAAGEVLYAAPTLAEMQLSELQIQAAATLGAGTQTLEMAGQPHFCERMDPVRGLWIFGAGDDAQPLAEFAHKLGWWVAVADGRSNLARPERFPLAQRVFTLTADSALDLSPRDAAVLMTHSYEQDQRLLGRLLPFRLAYLGVLGPRRRTEQILEQLMRPENGGLAFTVEAALARLHAPVGIFIGAHSPASIALSIAAEIQGVFAAQPTAQAAAALAHAR
jgi:xanthine dehydrogenase accessory factor